MITNNGWKFNDSKEQIYWTKDTINLKSYVNLIIFLHNDK